jgi:hypothetical protein
MALLRITACEAANRKTQSAAATGTQHPWRVPIGPAALPGNITQNRLLQRDLTGDVALRASPDLNGPQGLPK